ncbi:hypothetical protein CDD80_5151 [Ophiocordyceps camponoti-rufipedis]|uniref:Uncharacterized protein n=1 Tax=Ophiocordyceps camponoti-rufipedis TaxID=2004952 RepID=A0A2C5ZNS4_9HYPO|nr:hypothetical protein CDD80_5151 [Ophiocordyceps camponoti-rufipedis]
MDAPAVTASLTSLASLLWNRPFLELIGYTILYSSVFGFHTRRTVSTYNRKFQKSTSYALPVHIATGLFEIFRYQLRASLYGEDNVTAAGGDVIVCLIWAWSSLALVRSLRRGDPSTTRPAYQAGTLLRPVAALAAYLLQSPAMYRVCAKAINSFIYARVGIFIMHKSGFLRKHQDSAVYAICIPVSAILAIHEGRVPGAVPLYIAAMFAVGWLNNWVSSAIRERPVTGSTTNSIKDRFVDAMLSLGFAELDGLKKFFDKKRRPTSLCPDIMDEYIRQQNGGLKPLRLASFDSNFTGEMQRSPWDPLGTGVSPKSSWEALTGEKPPAEFE